MRLFVSVFNFSSRWTLHLSENSKPKKIQQFQIFDRLSMMEGSIFQNSMMKGMMKGKILKKLKSINQVGYLKSDRILQVRAAEGLVDSIQKISNFVSKKTDQDLSLRLEKHADVIIEEEGDGMEFDDKENVRPFDAIDVKDSIFQSPVCETDVKDSILESRVGKIDVSSFRRPDLNAGSLFDPKLLEAFEEVKKLHRLVTFTSEEKPLTEVDLKVQKDNDEKERPLKVQKMEPDPLADFELKCPPGGSDSIILYTTTLRGIRKTFENCQSIKFLLQTFKVHFFERDVSMHSEYRTEMCGVLGNEAALPPRLFVKGRYIGGADEVLRLHEEGKFRVLLDGIGVDEGNGMCDGCGGVRFVLCFRCNGSMRVDFDGSWDKCGVCNENGLIVCPYCC